MTPQPIDYIFIEISSAYTEEILLDSGLKLFLDPTYRREQNVTSVGKVVSLPKNSKGEDKAIINDLKVGDEVCFSYSVISDITFADESTAFQELTTGSDYFKKWMNSKGEVLTKIAMPGIIGQIWVSSLIGSDDNYIDGVQGSEHDTDRFLSQFQFGTTDTFKFKRLLEIDGREIWMAKAEDIYAKRVNGKLQAVGTRVLMKPIDYVLSKEEKEHLGIILTSDAVIRIGDRAIHFSGGEEIGLKDGDIAAFEKQYCEVYDFFGEQIYLLKHNRILGTYGKS